AADEALVEVDAALVERDGFRYPQSGAVEQLHEREVAQVPRLRSGGCVDQPLGFSRGEGPRQLAPAARQVELGSRVVLARAEQLLVAEERAHGRYATRDRRRRQARRAQLRDVTLEVLGAGRRRGRAEEVGQVR